VLDEASYAVLLAAVWGSNLRRETSMDANLVLVVILVALILWDRR
jgi:hypothetical protein